MNIGIDIDGVLTDIHGFNMRYAPKYFEKKYNKKPIFASENDIKDIFQCSEDERNTYWRKFLFRYAVTETARKGSAEFTYRLKSGRLCLHYNKTRYRRQEKFCGFYYARYSRNLVEAKQDRI